MADFPPKKNTAHVFYVFLVDSVSGQLRASPTLAAGDVKVAVDDAAPANITTLPVVDADFTKRVKVSLSSSEMNGDNISIIFSDAAGAEWNDVAFNIPTVTRQLTDLAYPTTSGRSMDVDASGGVEVGSFQAGAITAAAIATGAVDADALAADAGTEIATAVWAAVLEGAHTAADILRLCVSVLTGKSSGGGTTTVVFRNLGDSKNRISATVDANGNRTAVGTRDGT